MDWSGDDRWLASCGEDGAIYYWDLTTGDRAYELVTKSCSYYCVTIAPDKETLYATGSDKTMKEISKSEVKTKLHIHHALTSEEIFQSWM